MWSKTPGLPLLLHEDFPPAQQIIFIGQNQFSRSVFITLCPPTYTSCCILWGHTMWVNMVKSHHTYAHTNYHNQSSWKYITIHMNEATIQKNIKSQLSHDQFEESRKSIVFICVFMLTSKLKKQVSQYFEKS